MVPFAPFIGDNFVLMVVATPAYPTINGKEFLNEDDISRLRWPVKISDTNFIEHV